MSLAPRMGTLVTTRSLLNNEEQTRREEKSGEQEGSREGGRMKRNSQQPVRVKQNGMESFWMGKQMSRLKDRQVSRDAITQEKLEVIRRVSGDNAEQMKF